MPGTPPTSPPAVPPLTRGSTRSPSWPHSPGEGSPAHAGIDPFTPSVLMTSGRFPRSRGDRPFTSINSAIVEPAPSLTRGSTRGLLEQPAHDHGSPAHAGIDPRFRRSAISIPWLPRSRGDRPSAGEETGDTNPAPPLTRGSTPPARGLRRAFSRLAPLPLTRGSRPHVALPPTRRLAAAPPLTRGSTRLGRVAGHHVVGGSPAHGGIDPTPGRVRAPPPGSPRSRGDRPSETGSLP